MGVHRREGKRVIDRGIYFLCPGCGTRAYRFHECEKSLRGRTIERVEVPNPIAPFERNLIETYASQDAELCMRIVTDAQGRQAFGKNFWMSKEPISVLEFQQTTFKKDNDNMKIISVKYERVSNLGGYETERVQAEATVDDGENPVTVAANLKTWVNEQLGIVDLSADQIKQMERALQRAQQRAGR